MLYYMLFGPAQTNAILPPTQEVHLLYFCLRHCPWVKKLRQTYCFLGFFSFVDVPAYRVRVTSLSLVFPSRTYSGSFSVHSRCLQHAINILSFCSCESLGRDAISSDCKPLALPAFIPVCRLHQPSPICLSVGASGHVHSTWLMLSGLPKATFVLLLRG